MHYPDSRWRPRCQGKSRDDVSGRINQRNVSHIKFAVTVWPAAGQIAFPNRKRYLNGRR